jgi:hypothetical protein
MFVRRIAAALALFVAAACGDSSSSSSSSGDTPPPGPLVLEDGCQPLLAHPQKDEISTQGTCLLPYPSDFYLKDGRVTLSGAAKPKKKDGGVADPHDVVAQDGASIVPTIVATLRGKIVRDGLPGVFDEPPTSARAESPTVIVRADDGSFVPHYVDVPDRAPVEEERKPIVLRPIAPLAPKTRYVVAIRGVRLEGGGVAAPAEGFRRLRDKVTGDPSLAPLAGPFESDVFGPLERAGVKRADLQLAWTFTTGSAEQPVADMLRVRELTLEWLRTNTPEIKVAKVTDGADPVWKIVDGTITGPMFVDSPAAGAHLARGADGKVEQRGTAPFDFKVVIPKSVHIAGVAGRALGYGHGFFGGTTELQNGGANNIAQEIRAVLFGTTWIGMSNDDLGAVTSAFGTQPERVTDFAERVHQAMANWLVLTSAIKGPMTKLAELQDGDHLVYDPSFVSFLGISQGHILGGTMIALNDDISRAVLNVGGGGFTHMMPRSSNFGPFALLVGGVFSDPLVTQAFVAMFQRPLDRIDPISYAPLVFKSPLPGAPTDRRIVMQNGLGDPSVPNVGTFLHARALGVKQTVPAPKPIALLETTPGNEPVSAITLFDFGIDLTGYQDPSPLAPNQVHEGVRRTKSAIKQMDALLKPGGVVIHPCDGPCDPE